MDADPLGWLVPKEVEPPEKGTRLFAIRGCGEHGHGHTALGVHLGYSSGWGPASLCGSGNDSLGVYRHHIWTEVEATEINCRICYERGKELTRE